MISVIMSTYKEKPAYIHQSIRSILEQTVTDFELIIVMDDPDNREIETVLMEYARQDSRITVIKNEKNLGLPQALNRALREVKGDYIARMDADDISHPDRFEVQLRYMKEHDLDLVGTLKQWMDEDGNLIPGRISTYYPPDAVMKRLRGDDCLPHSSWLAKKEVFTAVGGYRNMPRCEDYDFLLRVHKRGVKMGLCDAVLLDYRMNFQGITRTGQLQQLLASRYLIKNYNKIEQITVETLNEAVGRELTPEACAKYDRASVCFDRALAQRRKNPVKCAALLFRCMWTSKYYRYRLMNILKLKLVAN